LQIIEKLVKNEIMLRIIIINRNMVAE
jgi:disulfide oxidoreductase YuzD